jgi:hypothetical protein
VRLVLFLWGGLYLALGPFRALNNADLYWQQWLGEYILRFHHLPTSLGPEAFTAAGAAWVPQEWVSSLLVALTARGHLLVVLAVGMGLVPIGILLSIYFRSRRRASPEAIAAVLMLTGVALIASFGIRAQVLGWGCFAAFLYFVERRDRWSYAAVAIVAIWANLHASVMLAPAFLAARIAGNVATDGVRGLSRSRDLAILALAIPAVFCTPLGSHLPWYAVTLAMSPIRQYIQEWQPVTLGDTEFLFGGLLLALAIVLGGRRAALSNKAESFPIALLFIAMLLARRNVPLFAIAAAPLGAQSLDALFPSLSRFGRRFAEMERFAFASSGIAIALVALMTALHQRREPPPTPLSAMAKLAANQTPHRIFCENFSECSAALQYPQLQVFIDGRADPYPPAVWRSYISIVRLEPSWNESLDRYNVDAVLAANGSRLADALASTPAWRAAFRDRAFVLYLHYPS